MRTEHRLLCEDARNLDALEDDAVELVVTSPPYPMVEMWDGLFEQLNERVRRPLSEGEGREAFEQMHAVLDQVWKELERVLVPGGIACVNIGDAVRRLGGSFQAYPNHARILDAFQELGFQTLPDILWRKPTNSPAKFVGSGMLPPNAYATLEHEYILIFRNGGTRQFPPNEDRRYEAAFFWEERNEWFSDVWTDVQGTFQALDADHEARERSAAFPFEIPYRLISMYSVYGDTVLDPFWGTGTTTLAAMVAARNSIGVELEEAFMEHFQSQIEGLPARSRSILQKRLIRHRDFARGQGSLSYESDHYGFPVTTRQEKNIRFYACDEVEATSYGYTASHVPLEARQGDETVEPAEPTTTS